MPLTLSHDACILSQEIIGNLQVVIYWQTEEESAVEKLPRGFLHFVGCIYSLYYKIRYAFFNSLGEG